VEKNQGINETLSTGVSVHVSNAAPKAEQNRNQQVQSYNYNSANSFGMHSYHPQGNHMNPGRNGHHRGNNQHNAHGGENAIVPNNHNIGTAGYGMGGNNYGGNSGGGYHNNGGNHSSGGNTNRQDGGSQYNSRQSNFHGMNQPHNGNVGGSNGWMNRGHLDMPNLQALGINSQGSSSSNQGQNMSNQSMLNLNSLPINPALVAAALNQWSLVGNQLQNQNQDQQASLHTSIIVSNKKLSHLLRRAAIFYLGWLRTGATTMPTTLVDGRGRITRTTIRPPTE